MRERDTSGPRPCAIRAAAQFHPRRREFPERGFVPIALAVLGLGVSAAGAFGAPPAPGGSDWSRVVVVDSGHAAGPVLQAAFHRVAATGIGGAATAQVLKRLGDYVESEVAQKGKAGLSIGLMADATTAAKAGKWPPEDMARLVVALHRKFDPSQPQEWPKLQKVVDHIRDGSPPDEILGAGDTLREAAPAR